MFDLNAQIDAVDRSLGTFEVDGLPARVQTLSQTFPSPIDDVWEALTTAARIPHWFLPISGELSLGGRYQLEGNAGGTVLECEPPTTETARFRVTWEYGGGVSWLTVRLTSTGDGATLLELEHAAPTDMIPAEVWDQFGPGATGIGWDQGLLGLAMHLTDPGSRPEDPAGWQVSDEGRRFSRRSADAWAGAHVADGAAPETARAAADTVYAMYAGEAPDSM
jgi:uncharacterized protein YndB with AHSA1/START domain